MVTYREAGVDIDAGRTAVDRIRARVALTHARTRGQVIERHGGYSGLMELPKGYRIVGSTTDGVGTKLLLAILLNKHGTVGIDLVAMCVNDLLVDGLIPWSFLDYIAMDEQIPDRTEEIIDGVVEGCLQAGIALIGGEMAEMPDMYPKGRYDLAGFASGIAEERCDLLRPGDIKPGMYVYGLPSSGVHSNGFSLIRKVYGISLDDPDAARAALARSYPELDCTLGEELLEPTRIYVKEVLELREKHNVVGLTHITGGGLLENPPRILPDGCAMRIDLDSWEVPPIFRLIQERGRVFSDEALRTFNMGLGMLLVSPDVIADEGVIHVGEIVEAKTTDTQTLGGRHLMLPKL